MLRPLLRDFGITRVANVTGLDLVGIPTVLVVRPNSRSLSVSQGKGATLEAAEVSGIMEAIEQFHAERVATPLRLASLAELRGRDGSTPPIDVSRLPRSTAPLGAAERTLWIEARVLGSSTKKLLVPYELVHLDMTVPLPSGSGHFAFGSNGLASGCTLSEALAHATWEVVERDAIALFFALRAAEQALRRIRIDSIDCPTARSLLARFEAADIGVAVWDATSDVGLPVFIASAVERELDPFRRVGLARGYGCHVERDIALCRALTEAAQSRLTRIVGSRDDMQREDIERIRSPETIGQHIAQLAEAERAERRFAEVPSRSFAGIEPALEYTRQRLEAIGSDLIAYVDLSDPRHPFAVARVVVPGLEGLPEAPTYTPGARVKAIRARH